MTPEIGIAFLIGLFVGGLVGTILGAVPSARAYSRGQQDTLDSIYRRGNAPTPIRRPNRDPDRRHP